MRCIFKKLFVIEGNIGAGKSTLIQLLGKKLQNASILSEPVEEWKTIGGINLLNYFYSNPSRWCFTFEVCSMISKIKKLNEAYKADTDIIFMERSLFSDQVFQKLSFFLDKITPSEMIILQDLFNHFRIQYPRINGIIYLNTDTKTCMQRIKNRARREESKIDEEYLKKLEKQLKTIEYSCPILEIDGNYDPKKVDEIIDKILIFIKNN